MISIGIVLFVEVLCLASRGSYVMAGEDRYPQEALECYASSAVQSQKEGKLICPPGTTVCVKEVINATSRADCGAVEGPHFGRDVWDIKLAQCVYRKCAAACPSAGDDAPRAFGGGDPEERGGLPAPVFNRTSYCCETNLCNHAATSRRLASWLTVSGVLVAWLLFCSI